MSASQDVAFLLMRKTQWEPDTLFLVFEEDIRFEEHEAGAGEPTFLKAKGLQEVVGEVDEPVDDQVRVPLGFTKAATSLVLCVFVFSCKRTTHQVSLPSLHVCVRNRIIVEATAAAVLLARMHACMHAGKSNACMHALNSTQACKQLHAACAHAGEWHARDCAGPMVHVNHST